MNYSFFGTCYKDYSHLKKCFLTLVAQSIKPSEIILVNSGGDLIKPVLMSIIGEEDIKLKVLNKDLSRIDALNLAIDEISYPNSIRFDSRSRFPSDYAEKSLAILSANKRMVFVGGAPNNLPENNTKEAMICSEIMQRSYIFGYPRHRNINYTGYCSSIYLGCFNTDLLKKIKYREGINLISEDSQIAVDFINKGYEPWLDKSIRPHYVVRGTISLIFRLFFNYGLCRANTILSTGDLHSKSRYLIIILCFISINFLIALYNLYLSSFSFLIALIIYDYCSELFYKTSKRSFYIPFLALICQLNWIIGFLKALLCYFNRSNKKSNFLK